MYRFLSPVAAVAALLSFSQARAVTTLTCSATSTPLIVHSEGLTEAVGDIVIDCSGGTPGESGLDNVILNLNVNVTNRIDAARDTDIVLTVDSGSGPVQVSPPGMLMSPTTVAWNGVPLTLSPSGTIELVIANLRANATQVTPMPGGYVVADVSVSGSTALSVNQSNVIVATVTPSLFSNFSSSLICGQSGARVPQNLSFASFIAAHAVFTTTRVTEGWAAALTSRNDVANFDADSGHRILVTYSGLAPGATLYVPIAVAGADAVQPTAGGDFGVPASGGKYAPIAGGGSLLLSLVSNADATGAGGTPLYLPGAPGSGTVSFDELSAIPVTASGTAYAVYEVMDASDSTIESAQFPTFLAVAPIYTGVSYQGNETVMLAPVSTVGVASLAAPVPRFIQTIAPSDCGIVGDCGASYFPHLAVESSTLAITQPMGISEATPFELDNTGTGLMNWTSSITYQNGSGWLSLNESSGLDGGVLTVNTDARVLSPGTYRASISFDGGPVAGAAQVAVTLTVTGASTPAIASVSGAANAASRATPGSLAVIAGNQFAAPVIVSFDGAPVPAQYISDQQVNVVVPVGLSGRASTQLVLSSNGVSLAPYTLQLAAFSPAIFENGVLNHDGSVNGTAHPSPAGANVIIRTTGLTSLGTVTVRVGGVPLRPASVGPAPGSPGVQQVTLTLPERQQHGQFLLQVCEAAALGQPVCSPFSSLTIGAESGAHERSVPRR